MLDLKTLAVQYIPISLEWQNKPAENQWDEKTIKTVNTIEEPLSDRVGQIHRWLQSYHVLQSFTAETEKKIAGEIIAYADSRKRMNLDMKQELILDEFNELVLRLQKYTPKNKSNKPRKLHLVVSKALLCYRNLG